MKRAGWVLGLALLVLFTVAISAASAYPLVEEEQPEHGIGPAVRLEPAQPIGQTFVARHSGLEGIDLFLHPTNSAAVTLTLRVQSGSEPSADLATVVQVLPPGAAPGYYRFSFPPVANSHGRYYGVSVRADAVGVGVPLAQGGSYRDGAAYLADQPLDSQTSFRLVYDPVLVAWGLIQSVLGWLGLLGMSGLLLVLPGWALLDISDQRGRLSWAEMLALSAGLGLALAPLLLLWTDLLGLHLGPANAWVPALGAGAVLAWRHRRWRPSTVWGTVRQWARSTTLWPDLTLLLVLGLVFGVRFLVISSLDAPLWGDSVEHATMAQLLVDQGGLAVGWEPYAPFRSFSVHFGFATMTALLSWALGLSSTQATLLAGQIVNGLAVLTLYPLAVRITQGNRWAGVGAVLTAGLLSPMPAYYVNWGRYAQLTGQAILPVALWLMCETADDGRRAWAAAAPAGAAAAGMTLAYYRMPFYYAVFVVAWLIAWGLPRWRASARQWFGGLFRLIVLAGVAGMLLLPLALRLKGGALVSGLGAGLSTEPSPAHLVAEYQVWRNITFYVPAWLLVGCLLALLWSLVQRRWAVAAVGLWIAGLFCLVAAQFIHLPGANMMQNFAIAIALYIPVALLVGWLCGELVRRMERYARPWAAGLAFLAVAVLATVGQVKIVQAANIMVTRPDSLAMKWIRQNTEPEALFLVEGFRIYGGTSAVGSDAGWWIPLLAGRQNTMPPQYALLAEVPNDPGYGQRVVDLVAALETTRPDSDAGLGLLCGWGISHVYVGQGQGTVGSEASQLFSPAALEASSDFQLVYRRDRVWIFALDRRACLGASR